MAHQSTPGSHGENQGLSIGADGGEVFPARKALTKDSLGGIVSFTIVGRLGEVTHDRIEINPNIMFGKPVIKGSRITVEQILRKVAGGMSIDEILTDHPHLTPDDIYAAVAFAADYLAQEEIILANSQAL